ncbi:MAG: HEAT repeat domain-containing protein, partial [Planctomycetaceae bacterium]|nr:HEAT repeat domain-containing protein [Planctomycetaceae bacterium]
MSFRSFCSAGIRQSLLLGIVLCGSPECKPWGSTVQAADKAEVEAAIRRGAVFLQTQAGGRDAGYDSLAALALLKSGTGTGQQQIRSITERVLAKTASGTYRPDNLHTAIYEAGVDLMLLADSDPVAHREAIEVIATFVIASQSPLGEWNYLGTMTRNGGDTSITSYAMLGLWAAARAGMTIPGEVWDNCATWHFRTQIADGGFTYHATPGNANGGSRHGTTTSGLASQLIALTYLYPGAAEKLAQETREKERRKTSIRRFGVLERIDLDTGNVVNGGGGAAAGNFNPKSPRAALEKSVRGGIDWLTAHWATNTIPAHRLYYMYGLERVSALAALTHYGSHDWYEEGSDHLLATQTSDGSWQGDTSPAVSTSFAILFLAQATAKTLNRTPRGVPVGGGLLAGGRGLPDDLNAVQVEQGNVKVRKLQGPLDELLAELEKSSDGKVSAAQAAIVEQVQLEDRSALIEQKVRLRRLVDDPRVEVRRTAVWALGRTADLRLKPYLIRALRDPDLSVVVEARNSLCALSRLTRGQGMPASPLAGVSEDATADERAEAIQQW